MEDLKYKLLSKKEDLLLIQEEINKIHSTYEIQKKFEELNAYLKVATDAVAKEEVQDVLVENALFKGVLLSFGTVMASNLLLFNNYNNDFYKTLNSIIMIILTFGYSSGLYKINLIKKYNLDSEKINKEIAKIKNQINLIDLNNPQVKDLLIKRKLIEDAILKITNDMYLAWAYRENPNYANLAIEDKSLKRGKYE